MEGAVLEMRRRDQPPAGRGAKYRLVGYHYIQTDREKKARTLANDLGLTREERLQLLQWLPYVPEELDSWKALSERTYHDLITLMEGFLLISHMFNERR